MATKQQPAESPKTLVRKYKDKVGRIITVFKELIDSTKRQYKYTIDSRLYDKQGQAISLISIAFPDRKACMQELKKYPRETNEVLLKQSKA